MGMPINNNINPAEILQRWQILAQVQQNQPILTSLSRPANIFSNFATASAAFSVLNNALGAKGNFGAQFSPDVFLKLTNPLEKFLTIKAPITNAPENNQVQGADSADGQPRNIDNKIPSETTEKPPENKIPVKAETTNPKSAKTPIDPRLLGPTCYLIGPSISDSQDLTPKQIQARKTAQANNNETLKKLS